MMTSFAPHRPGLKWMVFLSVIFWVTAKADNAAAAPALPAAQGDTASARVAAPLDLSATAEVHYYSTATLFAYEWGKPDKPLPATLFLDGRVMGTSPLAMQKGFFVDQPGYALSAHLAGYRDALRPRVALPQEGVVKIAMLPRHPGAWYTIPCFCLGAALVAAGFLGNNQGASAPVAGTGLIAGGASVMVLAYGVSWFETPLLEKSVEDANNQAH